MQVYEFYYWGRSEGEMVHVIQTKPDLGNSEGSFYGFYNSRGSSVSESGRCWRGYRCFQWSSSSRDYRMGSHVRSVSGANGTFDIMEIFDADSDVSRYVICKYFGSAKRIDSNLFAVRQ